jgi:uncharacterized membrane protein
MENQTTRSIIVKADVSTAYQVWENFENFPHFMKNIKSVQKTGPNTSHWKMDGPLGTSIEWNAETTRKEENKRIAWNSKDNEDSDITTSGQVTFNNLQDGETEITVTMHYVPRKGGAAGSAIANLFSNPEKQLEEDLRNFKDFVEGRHDRIGG